MDAELVGVLDRQDPGRLAPERQLATVRGDGAADDLRQRRLARAVVADEGDDLTRVELERCFPERLEMAVPLRDRVGPNGRHARWSRDLTTPRIHRGAGCRHATSTLGMGRETPTRGQVVG